jgi:uncharacterized protein with gpF-like domain
MLNELTTLSEALTIKQRERRLQPMEKKMARQVALWFRQLGPKVVRVLRVHRQRVEMNALMREGGGAPLLREALSYADWAILVSSLLNDESYQLQKVIDSGVNMAMVSGFKAVTDDMGFAMAFGVTDPRALAYARGHAAGQVTRINQTTMKRLNTTIVHALENGHSWQRLARAIEAQFDDFAGPPLFPSKKFFSRAQAVAAYEIGNAYEHGSKMAIEQIMAAGNYDMEKKWLNAGDGNVRPNHVQNGGAGWLPYHADWPSGEGDPPTDPGCRCTIVYQIKK